MAKNKLSEINKDAMMDAFIRRLLDAGWDYEYVGRAAADFYSIIIQE